MSRHKEVGGDVLKLPLPPPRAWSWQVVAWLLRFGLLPVALLLKPPFHGLLALAAFFLLRGRRRRRGIPFVALEVRDRAHCWLLDTAGRRFPAHLLAGSCLHPCLTTLYLRYDKGLYTVFLPPGPGATSLHRRLRMRLALPVPRQSAVAPAIDPPG